MCVVWLGCGVAVAERLAVWCGLGLVRAGREGAAVAVGRGLRWSRGLPCGVLVHCRLAEQGLPSWSWPEEALAVGVGCLAGGEASRELWECRELGVAGESVGRAVVGAIGPTASCGTRRELVELEIHGGEFRERFGSGAIVGELDLAANRAAGVQIR